jgi:hypothetical protein
MGDFELLALHFEWEHLVLLSRHPPRREDSEKLSRRRLARRHLFFPTAGLGASISRTSAASAGSPGRW